MGDRCISLLYCADPGTLVDQYEGLTYLYVLHGHISLCGLVDGRSSESREVFANGMGTEIELPKRRLKLSLSSSYNAHLQSRVSDMVTHAHTCLHEPILAIDQEEW